VFLIYKYKRCECYVCGSIAQKMDPIPQNISTWVIDIYCLVKFIVVNNFTYTSIIFYNKFLNILIIYVYLNVVTSATRAHAYVYY
jgi:hypothetical protein